MTKKIGFIGLGIMGKPMALNLLKAGHALTVFDLNEEAIRSLQEAGAKVLFQQLRQLLKAISSSQCFLKESM